MPLRPPIVRLPGDFTPLRPESSSPVGPVGMAFFGTGGKPAISYRPFRMDLDADLPLARRTELREIAIACLREVTFGPDLDPECISPSLNSFIPSSIERIGIYVAFRIDGTVWRRARLVIADFLPMAFFEGGAGGAGRLPPPILALLNKGEAGAGYFGAPTGVSVGSLAAICRESVRHRHTVCQWRSVKMLVNRSVRCAEGAHLGRPWAGVVTAFRDGRTSVGLLLKRRRCLTRGRTTRPAATLPRRPLASGRSRGRAQT